MRTLMSRAGVRALKPNLSRRRFLAAGAAAAASQACAGAAGPKLRVGVVGAGLAGLAAALRLHDLGAEVQVFEAADRLGGRIHTVADRLRPGLYCELGAEFIDASHADVLALAERFDLGLVSFAAMQPPSGLAWARYYLGGADQAPARLNAVRAPLAQRLTLWEGRIEREGAATAVALDALSVAEWLEEAPALDPLALGLLNAAIRGEYGAELAEASALQLLYSVPPEASHAPPDAEEAAEAFTVAGGNSLLIEAIARALPTLPQTGRRLSWVRGSLDNGFDLIFEDGALVQVDRVVLALPPGPLAAVRLDVDLPQALRQGLAALRLGRVEKVIADFAGRPWRSPSGFFAEAYGDWGFATAWDCTRSQAGQAGALTFLQGGDLAAQTDLPAEAVARGLVLGLDRFVPGTAASFTGAALRTDWADNPLIGGGYLNLRPGQMTDPARPRWEESQTDHAVRPVSHGGIAFAGEHLSEEFYGYMNGAAQTGRLAAQWLMNARSRA